MAKYKRQYYQPEYRSTRFTAIEDVLDVDDMSRQWFYIPTFRGYEISNDGFVRSMKHFRKFPYGILVKPKGRANEEDPSYDLTNDSCERVTIRRSQLAYLARTNPYVIAGYPRTTNMTDPYSRNMSIFSKKSIDVPPPDNTKRYPHFTVIEEDADNIYNAENRKSDITVPITSLDGSEYFGRKDIRTQFN
jgi:hypothetical protein